MTSLTKDIPPSKELEVSKENRTQQVGLGCGTLIVIAVIVFLFGNRGIGDLEREMGALRKSTEEIKLAVEKQGEQLPLAPPGAASPGAINLPLDDLTTEVAQLRAEIGQLKEAIAAQSAQLEALRQPAAPQPTASTEAAPR